MHKWRVLLDIILQPAVAIITLNSAEYSPRQARNAGLGVKHTLPSLWVKHTSLANQGNKYQRFKVSGWHCNFHTLCNMYYKLSPFPLSPHTFTANWGWCKWWWVIRILSSSLSRALERFKSSPRKCQWGCCGSLPRALSFTRVSLHLCLCSFFILMRKEAPR